MSDYSNYADQQLASLLAEDNQAVFKLLYLRYWKKLLAIAARRLNDQQDAEETVQDIFLNLWKRRCSLQLNGNFEHYFAVALKFEIINRLAKRSRALITLHNKRELLAQIA